LRKICLSLFDSNIPCAEGLGINLRFNGLGDSFCIEHDNKGLGHVRYNNCCVKRQLNRKAAKHDVGKQEQDVGCILRPEFANHKEHQLLGVAHHLLIYIVKK